jgi:hypothetical protein
MAVQFVQAWPGTNSQQTGQTTYGWSGGISNGNSPQAVGAANAQVTVGNLVIVWAINFTESAPDIDPVADWSMTDNATTPNSYTLLCSITGIASQASALAVYGSIIKYLPSAGNLNPTISSTGITGGDAFSVAAAEFSGGTLSLDGLSTHSIPQPASGSSTPGTITTTVNNDLIIEICEYDNRTDNNFQPLAGYTSVAFNSDGATYIMGGASFLIANGIYSANPTWNTNTADGTQIAQFALMPAPAPPNFYGTTA